MIYSCTPFTKSLITQWLFAAIRGVVVVIAAQSV
jgi:hypothetical protein